MIQYAGNTLEYYDCILKISPGTSKRNPYQSKTSYSTLAPWMGEDVRSGDCLPKTEVKKGLKKRKNDTKVSTKMVDEDTILTLIESKKVCAFYIGSSYTCY